MPPAGVRSVSSATTWPPTFSSRESPLGKKIRIGPRWLEVVGVLEKRGSFMGMASMDDEVVIPIQQFLIGYWRNPDFEIQVKAPRSDPLEDAREELRGVLRKVRHVAPGDPDDFAINQQEQVIQMFNRLAGTIAAVGLAVTGLSLFVGGIGIMNIMFVSVAERTREIGVRKAIGAKRRTILLQFLIEAASHLSAGRPGRPGHRLRPDAAHVEVLPRLPVPAGHGPGPVGFIIDRGGFGIFARLAGRPHGPGRGVAE